MSRVQGVLLCVSRGVRVLCFSRGTIVSVSHVCLFYNVCVSHDVCVVLFYTFMFVLLVCRARRSVYARVCARLRPHVGSYLGHMR